MDLPAEIEEELTRARAAAEDGNSGKARVCARRAVGVAFRQSRHSSQWPSLRSSTQILKAVSASETFSSDVRNAAARLSASVAENKASPVSTQPLKDALAIIAALLET